MFCPNCGAKALEGANFCVICGSKLPSIQLKKSEQEDKEIEAERELVAEQEDKEIEAEREPVAEQEDKEIEVAGEPVTSLNPSEYEAVERARSEFMTLPANSVYRLALEVAEDVRKELITLTAILPLVIGAAQSQNRYVLYFGDSSTVSRVKNKIREYRIMAEVEVCSWDQLGPNVSLEKSWIIGDIDFTGWKATPMSKPPSEIPKIYANGISRVLLATGCPTLLIHQKGEIPLILFPPDMHPKGLCFVATAAYSSPLAPEVQVLQTFRDCVLKSSALGRIFISIYNKVSPPFARWIESRPMARCLIRWMLIAPIVSILKIAKCSLLTQPHKE